MKLRSMILFGIIVTTVIGFLPSAPPVLAQAQEPIRGGNLIIPKPADAHHLNPLTWGTIYESEVLSHIYEPLVIYDVNDTPVPCLATGWSWNDSLTEYTFNIIDNATWHDGQLFTIDDVNFTYHLLWLDPGIPRRSWMMDDVLSITVVNDTAIRFIFAYSYRPADVLLEIGNTWMLPEHIWKDISDIYSFANLEPIGTGPFTLEEWRRGQFFRYKRFDNYWREGKPYVDEITSPIVLEVEAGYYALKAGDLQVIGAPPPGLEADARADPNIAVWNGIQDYFVYIAQNERRYPNNVKEFRHAVAYGTNRSEMVEVARYGRGVVSPTSCSLPFGPYYEPDIESYDYDPARANQILDDLGWARGPDGIRVTQNGTRLSFEFNFVYYAESIATAQMLQEYMAAIGVEITIQHLSWDVLWKNIGGLGDGTHDYDWAYAGWVGFWSNKHPNWAYWLFNSGGWWGDEVNVPGWQNDTLDTLTDEILIEPDEAVVKTKLNQVQKIISQELPYLPINFLGGVAVYRTDKFEGWITGATYGPNNWQSWLNVHLIAPEVPIVLPTMTTYMGGAMILITIAVIIIGYVKLRPAPPME
ncbi:MAG: ABC transporter substrate-binding protein [Promethearchaeota archaeon]